MRENIIKYKIIQPSRKIESAWLYYYEYMGKYVIFAVEYYKGDKGSGEIFSFNIGIYKRKA